MADNENREDKEHPLEAIVSDQLIVSEGITVAVSDITVALSGPEGGEQQLVFDETCPSDLIASSVCEAVNVPAEEPCKDWLQEQIEETREEITKPGWKVSAEINVPIQLQK